MGADEEADAAASRSAALRAFSASFFALASAFLAPFLEGAPDSFSGEGSVVGREGSFEGSAMTAMFSID